MILCELLYKLVLFCDIVRVGKNSYCEFDKFEFVGVLAIENNDSSAWKSEYEMA